MLEILGDHWAASIRKNKNVAASSCLWIQYLLGSFQTEMIVYFKGFLEKVIAYCVRTVYFVV